MEVGVGEEIDHHGCDRGERRDAGALHQARGAIAVPAGHEHDGAAELQGGVHAGLHAGHVEQGKTASTTLWRASPRHAPIALAVACTERWVCTQPLALPVVPEV